MESRRALSMAVAGLLGGTLLGVPAADAAPTTAQAAAARAAAVLTAAAAAGTTSGAVVARYSFDGGRSSSILDESGRGHTLRLVSGNGGTVRAVPHRSGQALRFPAKCAGAGCPRAALQSSSSADLNPGTRNISYGAEILLAPSQTSKGQNIVQKGYSTTSSQWKLQIDGTAGLPSCVLVGANPGIKLVRSSVSVADGSWHTVECRRTSTLLRVIVDGAVRGSRTISPRLTITNRRALSIGAKGAYADNDQFHGILDNIWVRIG
ncbi:LamG-like jellyroll fold domain-containing protein [Nucisporomicrobium flavum]|uniref:LamG-like jellyroll fold domain-containing protein n=1 Tax=Nucisporomicrobium flavum TaxID=2785915 RepID=UPI001F431AB0|nr:LamG-like jellyroll fold domain-containing protein [Nucisporomicrobium flavum]